MTLVSHSDSRVEEAWHLQLLCKIRLDYELAPEALISLWYLIYHTFEYAPAFTFFNLFIQGPRVRVPEGLNALTTHTFTHIHTWPAQPQTALLATEQLHWSRWLALLWDTSVVVMRERLLFHFPRSFIPDTWKYTPYIVHINRCVCLIKLAQTSWQEWHSAGLEKSIIPA